MVWHYHEQWCCLLDDASINLPCRVAQAAIHKPIFLLQGTKNGVSFLEHVQQWEERSGAALRTDAALCSSEITTTVIWIPCSFAMVIAHGHFQSWALSLSWELVAY